MTYEVVTSIKSIFDLSSDSNYLNIGLSPTSPTQTYEVPFFRMGTNSKRPYENNKRALYREYYVFWINTGSQQPVLTLDNGEQLAEPCGEPVLGED